MALLDLSEADNYHVREEGVKRYVVTECSNCIFGRSIADYPQCMRCGVNKVLKAGLNVDALVLLDVYERLYDEEQTALLKEMAVAYKKLDEAKIWSYGRLGDPKIVKDDELSASHAVAVRLSYEQSRSDPVAAYVGVLQAIQRERQRAASVPQDRKNDLDTYLKSLTFMGKVLEGTAVVEKSKPYLSRLGKEFDTRRLYHTFFEPQIKPSFIGSRILFGDVENLQLVDEYMVEDTPVQIFQPADKLEMVYYVNPPEYTLSPDKYFILTRTKEIVSAYKPEKTEISDISTSREYFERIYSSTIEDVAQETGIKLSVQERESLARLVARYTVGYGTLEILFKDRKLTDIYLDAPLGLKPIYVVHSDYEQCQTNILFTNTEAKALVSRFRALSGRPFDEAHPILDYDLQDVHTRPAEIGPPLSPLGIALVFRLHKETPWTLPQEVDHKMMDSLAAGALSFFIDAQASSLINGSRGSGKTSLMTALMLEIPQNLRILVQEDTLEVPVMEMKALGFNSQRMKTRSSIGAAVSEAEVAPEDALRTALRLGDSVLIVGEVRSQEAKVLYEAMRVGAVGNVVMGTIHGENAYSVWDRIVNDLGVENTSFKATDIVVTCAPVRFGGSLRRHRRPIEITKIGKKWYDDPEKEGGLVDLITFDTATDKHILMEKNIERSEMFPRMAKKRGLTVDQLWQDIQARAETKNYLVEKKREHDIPDLLEGAYTVPANDKWLLLLEQQREVHGSVDYDEAVRDWKKWVDENQVTELLSRRTPGA